MAILSTIHCLDCGKAKEVVCSAGSHPTVCPDCTDKKEEKAKQDHLTSLARLSPHERIRRLEEQAYNVAHAPRPFDPRQRIG